MSFQERLCGLHSFYSCTGLYACAYSLYTRLQLQFRRSAFLARTAGVLIVQVDFSNDYWVRMYTRVALLPCHLGFAPTDQRLLTCFLFGSLWPARFYSTSRVVLLSPTHRLVSGGGGRVIASKQLCLYSNKFWLSCQQKFVFLRKIVCILLVYIYLYKQKKHRFKRCF